jgi:hypothetical protein
LFEDATVISRAASATHIARIGKDTPGRFMIRDYGAADVSFRKTGTSTAVNTSDAVASSGNKAAVSVSAGKNGGGIGL